MLLKHIKALVFIALTVSCAQHTPIHLPYQQLAKDPDELIAYAGYTGEYEGFTLAWDDRFNHFDSNLWEIGDGAVGGESACRFMKPNVQINNGVMELIVREQKVPPGWSEDHQQMKNSYDYSCGELRTRADKKIRYGRIEARIKAPSRDIASGYISSLFTYTNNWDDQSLAVNQREWEEIDIELEGGRPDKFQANLIYGTNTVHWWKTREYGAWEDKLRIGPVDQWRVFAIEWLPDRISWYVDGEHIKTLRQADIDCKPACIGEQIYPAQIPDNATNIMMNFWIPHDIVQDKFGGNKRGNVYPMKAEYDWLRYYQHDEQKLTGTSKSN